MYQQTDAIRIAPSFSLPNSATTCETQTVCVWAPNLMQGGVTSARECCLLHPDSPCPYRLVWPRRWATFADVSLQSWRRTRGTVRDDSYYFSRRPRIMGGNDTSTCLFSFSFVTPKPFLAVFSRFILELGIGDSPRDFTSRLAFLLHKRLHVHPHRAVRGPSDDAARGQLLPRGFPEGMMETIGRALPTRGDEEEEEEEEEESAPRKRRRGKNRPRSTAERVRDAKPLASAYRGVHWNKSLGVWESRRVRPEHNGRGKHLGHFDDEHAAAEAYDAAARELPGERAPLNFGQRGRPWPPPARRRSGPAPWSPPCA